MTIDDKALTSEVVRLHAEFCTALADQRRLLIIYALTDQPKHVNQLAEQLGFSQSSVSRHLKMLRERGLVKSKRRGSVIEFRLADRRLVEALDILRDLMRDMWVHRASLVEAEVRD
jgi:DNA-binding transcriptional ArsR family regulator